MRDIQKAINDYLKMFPADGKKGSFYASDAYQIREVSNDIWDSIFKALMAGFMVGYRYGKREQEKRSKTFKVNNER